MIRLTKIGVIGLIGSVLAAIGAETGRLPADQLAKAARSDSISIPTPGELFAALEKPGKTDWSGQYRGPMPITYRNRTQPRRLDCRWIYCRRSQGQPASQKYRLRHYQARQSSRGKSEPAQPRQ